MDKTSAPFLTFWWWRCHYSSTGFMSTGQWVTHVSQW